MKATNSGPLTIKKATFTERQNVGGETKAYTYQGFALRGWLNGQKIRKQFRTYSEALTENERLEIAAANTDDNHVRPVNTRLNAGQVQTAELLFSMTPNPLAAVKWYLANYRAPLVSETVENATADVAAWRHLAVSDGTDRAIEP